MTEKKNYLEKIRAELKLKLGKHPEANTIIEQVLKWVLESYKNGKACNRAQRTSSESE